MTQRHDPRKIYFSLRRRLGRIQSLARDEAWVTNCRVVGAPHWFAAERVATCDLRRVAMEDVLRMLAGLERSGAMTRAGAEILTGVFAIACRDAAGFGDRERRERHARRLRLAWCMERVRLGLRRLVRRSAV